MSTIEQKNAGKSGQILYAREYNTNSKTDEKNMFVY